MLICWFICLTNIFSHQSKENRKRTRRKKKRNKRKGKINQKSRKGKNALKFFCYYFFVIICYLLKNVFLFLTSTFVLFVCFVCVFCVCVSNCKKMSEFKPNPILNYIQSGIEIAKLAVIRDKEEEFKDAHAMYDKSLKSFLSALRLLKGMWWSSSWKWQMNVVDWNNFGFFFFLVWNFKNRNFGDLTCLFFSNSFWDLNWFNVLDFNRFDDSIWKFGNLKKKKNWFFRYFLF